jgi:hypothetical protein
LMRCASQDEGFIQASESGNHSLEAGCKQVNGKLVNEATKQS